MQKRSEAEVRKNTPTNQGRSKRKQPQNSPKQGRKFFLGMTTRPNQQRAKFGRFFLTFNSHRTKDEQRKNALTNSERTPRNAQNEQRTNKGKRAELGA